MRKFLFESLNSNTDNIHVIYETDAITEGYHNHDFIEIVYVVSGCMEHCINKQIYKCYKGDLLVIDTDAIHSFKIKNKPTYFNICIKTFQDSDDSYYYSLITKNIASIKNKIFSFEGDDRREIEDVMFNMYHEERCNLVENKKAYNAYANILAIKIIRKLYEKHEDYDNWNNVIEYINNNLDGQLSLHSIARTCSYNPSYFSRLFKAKVGTSFVVYANKQKIEKAKDYLLNTTMTIEEIAAKLGFASVQSFYKTFKTFVKMPPIKYKESKKGKQKTSQSSK